MLRNPDFSYESDLYCNNVKAPGTGPTYSRG